MRNLPTILCTGCSTCASRCPRHCIAMKADSEGFLYPVVDLSACIDCGLCETVCPVLHQGDGRLPLNIYVAKNRDEHIRLASSSGGIFTLLAERIIDEGGVVFGARFNENWEVIHDYTETKAGLAAFRGSKYVQSKIGDSYIQVKQFLDSGRKVLFSGTPCQIAGLKKYLRKEYNNLLTIDFICHGVPSPSVWKKYLKEEIARQCDRKNTVLPLPIHENDVLVEGISFRDKELGWKKYSFALVLSTTNGSGEKIQFRSRMSLDENLFMRGFLSNLYLRKSCYQCSFKLWKSGSDITLADAWGIDIVYPQYNDDKGYSLVIIFSDKGKQIITQLRENISIIKEPITEDYIRKHTIAAYQSVKPHKNRKKFFKLLNGSNISFAQIITTCLPSPSYMDKIIWSINKRLNKLSKLWK